MLPAGRSNMRKGTKIVLIVLAVILAACIVGLAVTGAMIGWGPFSFLHTWDRDVDAIAEKYPAEEHQGGIVFYGASNFAMWYEMENDLSGYKVQNHAFGGSTDKDLVEYAEKLLYPYKPSIVFFQTGSNDYVRLDGTDAEKVALCMEYKKQMFATFHEQMPDSKFVIMSGLLLPGRSEYTALTQMINDELEKLCGETDYLYFVDAEEMTFDGSNYAANLFVSDGIHLNHEGQLLWMESYIQPMIEEIIVEYGLDSVRKEK